MLRSACLFLLEVAMRIQTIVCDKCGEKIDVSKNGEKVYSVTCYGAPYNFVTLDICQKCIGDIVTEELLEKKKIQYGSEEGVTPLL